MKARPFSKNLFHFIEDKRRIDYNDRIIWYICNWYILKACSNEQTESRIFKPSLKTRFIKGKRRKLTKSIQMDKRSLTCSDRLKLHLQIVKK